MNNTTLSPSAFHLSPSPTFSIIIPVYNVAPYLRECLDSVLAQTFTDWEAICVDDGSTDGSGEILDEYREKVEKLGGGGQRIVVIHQKNAGVSAARNAALDVALGVWIILLDGDDAIHPQMLQFLNSAFLFHPDAQGLMFNRFYKQETSPSEWDTLPPVEQLRYTGDRDSETYRFARGTGWKTIYRRDVLEATKLRFDAHYVMAEDTLFAVNYYWHTQRWILAPVRLYFYRQRVGSAALSGTSYRIAHDWLEVEERLADWLAGYRSQWVIDNMRDFFAWNRQMVWPTYRQFFFKLPDSEMQRCLPAWISLQKKNFELHSEHSISEFYRKCIVLVVSVVRSAALCRWLVYREGGVLRRYGVLKRKFRWGRGNV